MVSKLLSKASINNEPERVLIKVYRGYYLQIYFDGKLMSTKKQEETADIDRTDVRDYRNPCDEDEYVDCFAMLELGESSRMGR